MTKYWTWLSYSLRQNRWKICTSPLLPLNQGWENGTFWLLSGFILDLGKGGGGLLFHFILSKTVPPSCSQLRDKASWSAKKIAPQTRGGDVELLTTSITDSLSSLPELTACSTGRAFLGGGAGGGGGENMTRAFPPISLFHLFSYLYSC